MNIMYSGCYKGTVNVHVHLYKCTCTVVGNTNVMSASFLLFTKSFRIRLGFRSMHFPSGLDSFTEIHYMYMYMYMYLYM